MTERLRPLEPNEWSEEVGRVLGGAGASRPPNILRTIAHHPPLLEPFLGFAAALALRGALERRDSELLALRTAWNCRSEFEWGHHVDYARAAGLAHEEIHRIPAGPSAADWDDRDRQLLRAADELHRDQRISDETWSALRAQFDNAQLVEIPFIVGNYTMLSMLANSTDVPIEEGLPGLPAR